MATADADLAALDARNAMTDQSSHATKFHLQTISGAPNLQTDIGTKVYIRHWLFGAHCPLTLAFTSEYIPFVDKNFVSFE